MGEVAVGRHALLHEPRAVGVRCNLALGGQDWRCRAVSPGERYHGLALRQCSRAARRPAVELLRQRLGHNRRSK